MEVLGSPPRDCWVRFRGVPLHVWSEDIFSLLNDYVGSTIEVDPLTSRKEFLLFGRVKIARDTNQTPPRKISLQLEDLCVPIAVALEEVEVVGGDKSAGNDMLVSEVMMACKGGRDGDIVGDGNCKEEVSTRSE